MSVIRVRKYSSLDEVNAMLNGGVRGGELRQLGSNSPGFAGVGANGIVGASLTFLLPVAATVIFAAVAPSPTQPDAYSLLFSSIVSQIEAAIPGVQVTFPKGVLTIVETTPTLGVKVAAGSAGSFSAVNGTIALSGVTGASLNTKTLVLKYDAGADLTTTFSTPADVAAILSQINANTGGAIVAQQTPDGKLSLRSAAGGAHSVQVVGASTALTELGLVASTATGLASNTANQLLGFDAAHDTIGKVHTPAIVVGAAGTLLISIETTNDGAYVVMTWE